MVPQPKESLCRRRRIWAGPAVCVPVHFLQSHWHSTPSLMHFWALKAWGKNHSYNAWVCLRLSRYSFPSAILIQEKLLTTKMLACMFVVGLIGMYKWISEKNPRNNNKKSLLEILYLRIQCNEHFPVTWAGICKGRRDFHSDACWGCLLCLRAAVMGYPWALGPPAWQQGHLPMWKESY